jgi:hypothetical protein
MPRLPAISLVINTHPEGQAVLLAACAASGKADAKIPVLMTTASRPNRHIIQAVCSGSSSLSRHLNDHRNGGQKADNGEAHIYANVTAARSAASGTAASQRGRPTRPASRVNAPAAAVILAPRRSGHADRRHRRYSPGDFQRDAVVVRDGDDGSPKPAAYGGEILSGPSSGTTNGA